MLCLLAALLIFIGGHAELILLLNGIKQYLYVYFKHNRKQLNNPADQENMDANIVKHLEEIQKKLYSEQVTEKAQCYVTPLEACET